MKYKEIALSDGVAKLMIQQKEMLHHRLLHYDRFFRMVRSRDADGNVEEKQEIDYIELTFDDAPDLTPSPFIDWKARWQGAATVDEKLQVLGDYLKWS